jgi:hypothetical protein
MSTLLCISVTFALQLLVGTALAEPQEAIQASNETQSEQSSSTLSDDQRREQINAGEVAPRGLPPGTAPGRMSPAGKSFSPGVKFSALTKAECTGLGCKAVTDKTCPDVGALTERCICKPGTKGVCIDAVK